MENLNSLPGDVQNVTLLDPSRAELVLPDQVDANTGALVGQLNLPDQTSPLGGTYRQVADLDPVTTAQKIDLAKRINEPEMFVNKNFDDLKKVAQAPSDGYWANFEKNFPESSKFLKDSKNMAIVKDDLDNLSKTERIAQDQSFTVDVYDALQSGLAGMYENAATLPALAHSALLLPQNLIAQAAGRPDLETAPFEVLLNNPITKHYAGQKKAYAPEGLSTSVTTQFKDGDYVGGAKNLILQVATNAPQQLMNIALGLSGAGLGVSMLASGSMQASGTLKESLDRGASPSSSTINAIAQGGFEAGIENMSFGTTGSIRAMKELGEVLTKQLGKEGAKKAIVEFGKQVLHSFGSEAIEEGVTQVAQSSTAYATGVNPNALDNIVQETADAMLIGGASGGMMTSVGATYQKYTNQKKVNRLKEMYLDLGKNVGESKLRERMPEAQKELLNEITKDGPISHIYLNANEATTYFQSKGLDLTAVGKELGIENEVNEAIETGGDIKIPLATWADKLVGTEHYEGLAGEVRFSPEDISSNDHTRYSDEILKQLNAQSDQANATFLEDAGNREQADAVYNTIKTDLINRGQDGKMAEQAAELWKSTAVASSARQGITIEEWFQKTRPTIVNGDESVPLKFERKAIPKFESDSIVGEDQVRTVLSELGLSEAYQSDESISAIRETLAMFQGEINEAEAGKRTFREGEFGGDSIVESIPSTFPKWFRENFKTKKDFLKVVSKGNSKYLGPVIQQAIKALKEGHGENPKNIIAPNLDFVSLVDPESLDSSFQINQAMNQGDKQFNQSAFNNRRDAAIKKIEDMGFKFEIRDNGNDDFGVSVTNAEGNGAGAILRNRDGEFKTHPYHQTKTDKEFQRMGLASAMYAFAERETGLTLSPGETQTPDAEKMWANPNRLFGKQETFNQNISDTKRGSVQFRKDQTILRLFKDADQSTFLHESAHIFFEDFYNHAMSGDASAKFMKDWTKLAEWLNYDPNQTSLNEDQHELFARGFERYLMEGDAPSTGLRRVFGQFRKWLTRIYKSVNNLNSEISPDVREVMSRMVATDNEIAIARKQAGLETEIDVSDMPDGVKAKLDNIRFEAEERAFAQLMKDQMKEISSDHKEFLKDKEKELTKEIRKEVEDSIDGSMIRDIKSQLKAKDIWATADKFIKGEMTEEKTLLFNMAAEVLGYSSGDHMAKEIQVMPSVDTIVKERVQSEMKKFSEFTDKEVVREKAKQLIHNEKSTELLVIEKEIFRKRLLEETEVENNKILEAMERSDDKLIKDWLIAKERNKQQNIAAVKIGKINEKHQKQLERLSEREKERKAREDQKKLLEEFLAAKDDAARKTKIKEYRDSVNSLNRVITGYTKSEAQIVKDQAKAILARKSHTDASKFTIYFTAERNAALRVAKAVSKNDWAAAVKAKQEQMLNHALARESMAIKKRASRHKNYLNEMRTASRESYKNEDHLFQASNILERFGYTRADHDSNFQGETLDQWVTKYDEALGIVNIPAWILDERTRIKTDELTIGQLEDIRNAIKNIKQVANFEDQLFALHGKESLEKLEGKLLQASSQNFDPKNRFSHRFTEGKWDKFKGWMRQYMYSLKKVETTLGPLDNWEENGIWTETFKGSVYEAANNESKMVNEAAKKLETNWSIYTNQERKDIFNKDIFVKELNITLKKESLLAMAHNLGNDGNRARLFETRPVGIDASAAWGEGIVLHILQRELNEKDWRFVQSNWNLLDSFFPKIAALHKEMTGFTPGRVENKKFSVITNGQKIDLDGGYYPLAADTRGSMKAENKELADAALYTEQNPAWKASTKTGHTKERTGGKYPVSLNLSLINRHMQDVIHDLTFRPIVTDLRRLTSRPLIQAELKATLTPEGHREIDNYVKAIAGAAAGDPISAIEKAVKIVRQRTTVAVLMFKVSTITQNFANAIIFPNAVEGFTHADALKSYIKLGIGGYAIDLLTGNGDKLRQRTYEKSAFMKDRADSPDYTIEEVHNKFSKNEASEISKAGGGLMAWTDEFTNMPMWWGAYDKAISEGKSEKEAVKFADTLIERVAGSSRKYDVASIARGNEIQKIFTMFFSWLNTEHNRWMREMGIVKRDKDVSRALGFLAGRLVFQVAGAALMFRLPDFEDEEEVKKFAIANTVGYPLSFFPILRDVTGIIADQAIGARSFGYNPSPALASVEALTKFTGASIELAQGKTEPQEVAEKATKLASLGFGYPDQFNQLFFNIYDYTNGMEPQVKDIFKRRSKKER